MLPETDYDIAIVGGGLAGLTLAIQSANEGYSVVLFEKETYPFHKVCGEYISMESWDFLEQIGVPLSSKNLPLINQLLLTDVSGNQFHFKLPLGGFGISRFELDNQLYKLAINKNVTVLTANKVTDIIFHKNTFSICTNTKVYTSKIAAGCFGKRSNLDIKWNRTFAKTKKSKLNNYIGIKYHIKIEHAENTIALHNFKNGYCGMSSIENDKTCLCYLTTAKNLHDNGGSIEALEKNLLSKNPQLKHIFNNAVYLYDEPLAISQISFKAKSQIENHVLLIGDAAGMITPLCGNGMSMAMHASKIAFGQIKRYLNNEINRNELELNYIRQWKKNFLVRLWVGRFVQRIFGNNSLTSWFLITMKRLPFLAKFIIQLTHGKPF